MSWGPWIEHDGKGCPCKGQVVEVHRRSGDVEGPYQAGSRGPRAFEGNQRLDSWIWSDVASEHKRDAEVIRYRIRKPKGLTILERIAEQPQDERVGA